MIWGGRKPVGHDKTFALCDVSGNGKDIQGGGVAGKDRIFPADLIQLKKDLLFDVRYLRYGFQNEIGIPGGFVEIGRHPNSLHDRREIAFGDDTLGGQGPQIHPDQAIRPFQHVGLEIDQPRFYPCLSKNLGDGVPHDTRTDDGDLPDFSRVHSVPFSFPVFFDLSSGLLLKLK